MIIIIMLVALHNGESKFNYSRTQKPITRDVFNYIKTKEKGSHSHWGHNTGQFMPTTFKSSVLSL